VDSSRIYANGKSNGGGLTGLLACDPTLSTTIAAFAPVSGAFYVDGDTGKYPKCKASRHDIPILEFHGWIDNVISYEGGPDKSDRGSTVSIVEWVNGWAKWDGFDAATNVTTSVCDDNYPQVLMHSWDDQVIHYNISNYKHWWPTSYGDDDTKVTTCFDATKIIMDFFDKHSL
jgi:poly(3-hydroxybutyrate) depolymerase